MAALSAARPSGGIQTCLALSIPGPLASRLTKGGRTMYQATIREVAPQPLSGAEAAGVEASRRLQYSTLDHLPRATFAEEAAVALDCEAAEPGYLERMAESMGVRVEADATA